jgi:hypothetical protein
MQKVSNPHKETAVFSTLNLQVACSMVSVIIFKETARYYIAEDGTVFCTSLFYLLISLM